MLSRLCLNRHEGFGSMRVEVLPRQLRHLELSRCGLLQAPMDLIRLTRLTELRMDDNPIESWWQLQQRLPAALADLACLANLPLASNPIGDGWKHLPRQLQRLHVQCCRMQQVPPELARLTQLTSLSLADNPIESGWRYLPRQLQQLDLEWCGLRLVPLNWHALPN